MKISAYITAILLISAILLFLTLSSGITPQVTQLKVEGGMI